MPPLALEMYHRVGMVGPPRTVYGRPGDPRATWDTSEGVNALAAAAIAAAEVCEPCLYFYLPELDGNEGVYVIEWLLATADRIHSGQDPLHVSHRARAWHRTRHLLDAGTGGFRGPDTPGFAPPASFATLGPDDVQARYGLKAWQFECAVQAGILPPSIGPEAEPRWLTVLIDHDRLDPQFVNRTFGTRMPHDAAAAAEYLAARWGVPVEQTDIGRLEARDHLHSIGLLEGKPVYAPDHLDHLAPGMRSTDADTWRKRQAAAQEPILDAVTLQLQLRAEMRASGIAWDAPSPITVACPRCEAGAGQRCVAASGNPASSNHVDRIKAVHALRLAETT